MKTKKLLEFVETYKKSKNLDDEEEKLLIIFLKDCLDRKKLLRVKDVIYDKNNGIVKEIPSLTFTKTNKRFTLKNIDKRVSTIKSLTPKKTQGTVRNKVVKSSSTTDATDSSSDNEN